MIEVVLGVRCLYEMAEYIYRVFFVGVLEQLSREEICDREDLQKLTK
jgi:hypothetical protein